MKHSYLPHPPWAPEVFLPAKKNSGVSFTPTAPTPVLKPRHKQEQSAVIPDFQESSKPSVLSISPTLQIGKLGLSDSKWLRKTVHLKRREPGFKPSLYRARTHTLVNVATVPLGKRILSLCNISFAGVCTSRWGEEAALAYQKESSGRYLSPTLHGFCARAKFPHKAA